MTVASCYQQVFIAARREKKKVKRNEKNDHSGQTQIIYNKKEYRLEVTMKHV